MHWRNSIQNEWLEESWAWAMWSPSSRRPSRKWTRMRPRLIAERLAKGQFSMNDFVKQIRSIRGGWDHVQADHGDDPGSRLRHQESSMAREGQLDKIEAIVGSMTREGTRGCEAVLLKNKSRSQAESARGAGARPAPEVNKSPQAVRHDQEDVHSDGWHGHAMGKMKAMRRTCKADDAMARHGAAGGHVRPSVSTKTDSVKKKFKKRKKR